MTSIIETRYTESAGWCKGGKDLKIKAGQKNYQDLNCKDHCDKSTTCTAYAMARDNCATFTSVGVTGNGDLRGDHPPICYMKQAGIH